MNFRTKTFFALIVSSMAILGSCDRKPKEAEITLLYTTDLHGSVLPYDFNRDKKAATSLANVATYVKQEREKNQNGVLLLDAGDFLQGQPSIYYSNFEDTISRHLQARVMEFIGYDGATVGNHDIEPGEDVYARVQKDFNFPWLAANAIDTRTGEPFFQPYAVYNKNGIKIAVLGMITPNIHAWLPKYLWENLEFEDMTESAQKWIPYIQKNEKPDLIIGLFHSGSDYTVEGNTIDTHKNENGGIPAAMKVDGFDIILLGHDHQEKAEVITNNFGNEVVVLDAQTGARLVGRADIKLKRKGNKYEKEITPSLVEMKNVAEDAEFIEAFAADVDLINEYVDAQIGMISDTLRSADALYGPSEFMDLIHNAQLAATGAEVSFAGVLSTDAVIPTGKLSMRNLFTLYKYENLLYTMSLTGQEIKDFLEFGFGRQYNQMKSTSDHLLNFRKDENGNLIKNPRFGYTFMTPSFNFTSAAGIKYTVDVTKPVGERVTVISMSDGKPFDLDKKYDVAVNSYQASGGGGFFAEGLGLSKEETDARVVNASKKDVRKYIADYIIAQGIIKPVSRNDWKVIPENYFKSGKKNDMNLMNKK